MSTMWKCWKVVNARRKRRLSLFSIFFSVSVCFCLFILLPSTNDEGVPGAMVIQAVNEGKKNGFGDGKSEILNVEPVTTFSLIAGIL